jgi:hypothetical protein
MEAKLIPGAQWELMGGKYWLLVKDHACIGSTQRIHLDDESYWLIDVYKPKILDNFPSGHFADIEEAKLYVETRWILSPQS